MKTRNGLATIALAVLAGAGATQCSRSRTPPTPQVAPAEHAQQRPGAVANAAADGGGAAAQAGANQGGGAVAASGPRAELTGDHYQLVVAIAPPGAVPGDTALTLEVRGTDGYHLNVQYPSALDLTATNATATDTVRANAATSRTEQLLSFRVPVRVTGAGAQVRGTARFAVCSEANCIPKEQEFAVALP